MSNGKLVGLVGRLTPNPATDAARGPNPTTFEDDVRALAAQRPVRRQIGNSVDMSRIEELLSNGVTAAHDDTCEALDRVMGDARALLEKAEEQVTAHKAMLRQEGQRIAYTLQAAVQELTRTVAWLEEQGPKLRDPKLDPPPKVVNPVGHSGGDEEPPAA